MLPVRWALRGQQGPPSPCRDVPSHSRSLVVGGAVVAGAVLRDDSTSTSSAAPAKPRVTTTTLPPTTTTLVAHDHHDPHDPAAASARPDAARAQLSDLIGPGATGPVVAAFEQRLANLHFDPGPVDGVYDQDTVYAVQTLQKMVGLNPAGRIGAYEAEALRNFQYPQPLHPTAEPNRTEIDVTKQVLTLYENYQVRLVTTTSTGSGVHYCYDTPKDNPTRTCARSRRPRRAASPSTCSAAGGTRACSARSTTPSTSTRA